MLRGSIGSFDTEVHRVVSISGAKELLQLTPPIGGGIDFSAFSMMFGIT